MVTDLTLLNDREAAHFLLNPGIGSKAAYATHLEQLQQAVSGHVEVTVPVERLGWRLDTIRTDPI